MENLPVQDLEGCEDELTVEALEGQFFAYTVNTGGVRIRTSFPHVLEACNRTATVPFDQLRSYAASGGILARLAYAAGGD